MPFDVTEIRTQVRDRAELHSGDTLITDAVLLRFINRGLQRISLAADWPWLRASATVATVASTPTLALPTGWLRTMLLTHNDTAEPLTRVHLKEVRRILATDTGRPSIYSVDGSTITLRRVPDGAYSLTHDYVRTEPALSAGTDTPLIPEAYGQLLIERVAIWVFQKTQKHEQAQEAKADYLATLKDLRDNINQGREPLSITPRPGAWL